MTLTRPSYNMIDPQVRLDITSVHNEIVALSANVTSVVARINTVSNELTSVAGSRLTTALTSGNIIVGNASNVATAVSVTGDITITNAGVTAVGLAKITNAMLRNSTALTVIGRSVNSIGVPADIAAGTDGHILRRSGATLGFGTIPISSMTMNTASLLGRTTAGSGAVEEISAGTNISLSATTIKAIPSGSATTIQYNKGGSTFGGVKNARSNGDDLYIAPNNSGTQAWVGGRLYQFLESSASVSTGPDSLYTYTLNENTLLQNGDTVKFKYVGTLQGTGSNMQFSILWNSTNTYWSKLSLGGSQIFKPQTSGEWVLEGEIMRTNENSFRVMGCLLFTDDTNNTTKIWNSYYEETSANFTVSNDITLSVKSASGAAGDITAYYGILNFESGTH